MTANAEPGPTVEVTCLCRKRNPNCSLCDGAGVQLKRSCKRCEGTGKHGGAKCQDCRGDGWRELDNPAPSDGF